MFNVVFIIPTGIGCEIGGHSGDAGVVVRLMASLCDKLITHPNAVNAGVFNEMPDNVLYVEGSLLDRFLEGRTGLREVRQNKVLVVVNKPVRPLTVNAVSAARVTFGCDVDILELNEPLKMTGGIRNGRAVSNIYGAEKLVEQVRDLVFDSLAIATPVDVDKETRLYYWKNGGINPWGYVEAQLSKMIGKMLFKPNAHAPVYEGTANDDGNFVVDPRIAPEMVSDSQLFCVLKGLHRAPRPYSGKDELTNEDVNVLISPDGIWGPPHKACVDKGIPIIFVMENKVNPLCQVVGNNGCIYAENYWEAAGIIACMNAGITPASVRRPLAATKIKE